MVARNPRSASHPAEVDVDVDVDGDGCSERATWDGRVLQVDRRDTVLRFAVGRPRAQLLAGDWDGDGSRSVALYDPERGEVLYVDHFPAKVGDAVRAGRVEHAARHGRARVTGAAGGRQRVVVSLR